MGIFPIPVLEPFSKIGTAAATGRLMERLTIIAGMLCVSGFRQVEKWRAAMIVTIEFPDHLPDFLQETPGEFEREVRMALAVRLFQTKRIASGLAAGLVGMRRADFLLHLHEHGVAMIDLEPGELSGDFANA
jgi:predicted HTH domain antitoxin